jgi:hypothetical protein
MRSLAYMPAVLIVFLAVFAQFGSVAGASNGTFTVNIGGYSITGQLTDARIQADNTTSAVISVDQTVPASFGSAHVVGSGRLVGIVAGTAVHGTVEGFSGTVQVCFLLFLCQSSNFIGTGTWTGTLQDGTQGSGTYQGTITFDKSMPTVGKQVQVSGSWNVNFAT